MKPSFKISSSERLYLTKDYFCNGHWLVAVPYITIGLAPKAFKPLLNLAKGGYVHGIKEGLTEETTPDLTALIPKRDGYRILHESPHRVAFQDGDEIMAYVFKTVTVEDQPDFEVGISPQYVPILRMGNAFAKDAISPLIVLNGLTLNDDFMGIVMPRRITK